MIPPTRRYRKGNGQPPRRRRLPGSIPLPDLRGLARARPDGQTGYGRRGARAGPPGCGTGVLLTMILAAQVARHVRRAPPDRPEGR